MVFEALNLAKTPVITAKEIGNYGNVENALNQLSEGGTSILIIRNKVEMTVDNYSVEILPEKENIQLLHLSRHDWLVSMFPESIFILFQF
ncbi:MAG TPA: hypothetical protein VK205_12615 [Prolixibacteraceae bacterium]|nr:hypothetical protein [Prolixibacteraceae bacterium]